MIFVETCQYRGEMLQQFGYLGLLDICILLNLLLLRVLLSRRFSLGCLFSCLTRFLFLVPDETGSFVSLVSDDLRRAANDECIGKTTRKEESEAQQGQGSSTHFSIIWTFNRPTSMVSWSKPTFAAWLSACLSFSSSVCGANKVLSNIPYLPAARGGTSIPSVRRN